MVLRAGLELGTPQGAGIGDPTDPAVTLPSGGTFTEVGELASALLAEAQLDPATRLLTYTAMYDAITDGVEMQNPTLKMNVALFYIRIDGLTELADSENAKLMRDLAQALQEIVTAPESEQDVAKISEHRRSQVGRTDTRNELGVFFPDIRRMHTPDEETQSIMTIDERFEIVQQLILAKLQNVLDAQSEQIQEQGIDITIGGSTYKHGMNAKDLMRAADSSLKQNQLDREIERYNATALPSWKRFMRAAGNWALRKAGTGAHPNL